MTTRQDDRLATTVTSPQTTPNPLAAQDRAIRIGGSIAGATLLGGAIGASASPAWALAGALAGAAVGIGVSALTSCCAPQEKR